MMKQQVKMKRDYEIEIEFAIDFPQLGITFSHSKLGSSTTDEKAANRARGTPKVSTWEKEKSQNITIQRFFMWGRRGIEPLTAPLPAGRSPKSCGKPPQKKEAN